MHSRAVFTLSIIFLFSNIISQSILVESKVGSEVILSGNSPAPLWFSARQEGRWGLTNKEQLLILAQASMGTRVNNWGFFADIELDYNTEIGKCYFHGGYLKIDWYFLNLMVGRHSISPIFGKEYCGSGSFLYGDNFRPIGRITAGIPDYIKIPFTYDLLEIRGAITHGRLDDTKGNYLSLQDVNYFHKEVLLHEKYAYARLDLGKWKPYFGLHHSALMGGYNVYGNKIPIDYWNTFFAKSSDKIGGGDATNVAGAHMGMYDFGLLTNHNLINIHFYYQKPFSDGSGMSFLTLKKGKLTCFKYNKDQIVGLNIGFKNIEWFTNLTVEWINTKYQSGNGVPDPIYTNINGETKNITLGTLKNMDLNKFMKEEFGLEGEFTFKEVRDYLSQNFNDGERFGGRDGYMNNVAYPGGWTYYGMIMGSPLNLTRSQINHLSPNLGTYYRNYIINDRFRAFHIGGKGKINKNIIWKTMLTFSVNWGSYFNEYPGRYTWQRTENYFFDKGLKQFYSMFGIEWNPKKISKINIKSDIAFDNGEIFNNFGAKFGVVWNLY